MRRGLCLRNLPCLCVGDEWKDRVGEPESMEEDMLDFAFDVRPTSRLSCQIRVRAELDGLVVTTPQKQG
jgi:ferredoxin, 2Fe-2S